MKPFVKLSEPEKYIACGWDLSRDVDGRLAWVDFFKRHFSTVLALGIDARVKRGEAIQAVTEAAARCSDEMFARFDAFAREPDKFGRVTIIILDRWRDSFLQKHGFADAFIDLKARENERMLPLLPAVCRELDAMSGEQQFHAMVEGVFAGNIFDMGAEATARAFLDTSPDFFATRKTLRPRPWFVDGFDALARRMRNRQAYSKAVFFVDNAGSDFLLGALPMIRWLARRGTRVVIAANERPTLNDMTAREVEEWWPRVVAVEPSFGELPISRVNTGTGEPLIDLTEVSDELNAAAEDADLVVLEGMGRGVESNLNASFTCDVLKIAMIKDEMVAKHLGAQVFDCVLKFESIRA